MSPGRCGPNGRTVRRGRQQEYASTSRMLRILRFILFAFADGDDQSTPFNAQLFHDNYGDGDGTVFDDGDGGGGIGSAVPGADDN